jgi:hypothetical protein
LIEFNSSQLYSSLRQKLKKAIFRLAVEKYNKQVDHKGLPSKQQKEKFKAELYTFLQEQMKVFLNQAMDMHIENSQYNQGTPMHNDLIMSHKGKEQEIATKIEKSFKETEYEKFNRHYQEYNN